MGYLLQTLFRYLFSKFALFVILLCLAVLGLLLWQGVAAIERYHRENLTVAEQRATELRAEIGERHSQLMEQVQNLRMEVAREARQVEEATTKLREMERKLAWLRAFLTADLKRYEEEMRQAQARIEAAEQRRRLAETRLRKARQILGSEDPAAHLLAMHEDEAKLARSSLEKFEDLQVRAKGWIWRALATVFWPVFLIFLTVTLGPLVWRLLMYFVWAPLAQRARPIRLVGDRSGGGESDGGSSGGGQVTWSESRPAHLLELEVGEIALLGTRYLQSTNESFRARTQLLWSWRYPMTSLASGQFALTRLEAVAENDGDLAKGGDDGAEPRAGGWSGCSQVTVSDMEDGLREIAWVELSRGQTLCFRPSFLAGVVFRGDKAPQIERRWQVFSLQAWLTMQFGYFLVSGPCKVIFAAGRGLRVEEVATSLSQLQRVRGGRRINQDMTVAFDPSLSFASRRAETALAGYLMGRNKLFDDFFLGHGQVAAQQVVAPSDRRGMGSEDSFWKSLLSGLGKLFGL